MYKCHDNKYLGLNVSDNNTFQQKLNKNSSNNFSVSTCFSKTGIFHDKGQDGSYMNNICITDKFTTYTNQCNVSLS